MKQQLKGIALCWFLYLLFSVPVIQNVPKYIHVAMIWNLFLATLPLVFALLIDKVMARQNDIQTKKSPSLVIALGLGIVWLLFFPNAPYMMTDFIHLSGINFIIRTPQSVTFSTDITPWVELMHIGFGAFLGIFIGLFSLYIIHQILVRQVGKGLAHTIIVFISILSGYGIYIGRFLRFNSWDIINPAWLFSQLVNHFNWFTIQFSLLFALYIMLSYLLFYIFFHRDR